ncbi:SDR family oxidoreductase [Temperatibacter marinus]|uniref:SDR family oxidoreductase n=1 Tax=Temperatibacter marinus TaxID=1456591 RepID=A0AA52EAW4_9PROT|nr:SDR family oxidoreductase [Temperatibacter marinus]WND01952.1 SDR family oxidoreductase [Temperatibacter marinus]
MSEIRYDGQVAIVTGAGGGLGRSHALELAKRGAKVVVNDLGGAVDGSGGSVSAAQAVVNEIEALGGEALAHGANVLEREQVEDMVAKTIEKWGRIDVLINNAGILRDKSFAKLEMSDWDLVTGVHLTGTANCTRAVWQIMRDQNYGRIVVTSSSSGMYGNFGQANYGAAKLGVVGLMNTLCLEGAKNNIHVNTLIPVAATRMTESLMPPEMLELLKPELVTPAVIYLASTEGPNRTVLSAGAGAYSRVVIQETEGVAFLEEDATAENIAANWGTIDDHSTLKELTAGNEHTMKCVQMASKIRS